MPKRLTRDRSLRALRVAMMVVIIGAGLHFAQALVVPLLLGACIAISVEPIDRRLRLRGWPRYLSATAAIAVVMLVVLGFGALLGVAASELSNTVPKIQHILFSNVDHLAAVLSRRGFLQSANSLDRLDLADSLPAAIGTSVTQIAGLGTGALVVFTVAAFMVLEGTQYRRKLEKLVGGDKLKLARVLRVLDEVQRYLVLKTLLSIATGLAAGLLLAALDVEGALVWGLLAFALNYVPFLGAMVAAIPTALFAWAVQGPLAATVFTAGFTVIHLLVGNILEPQVFGRRLGLSPLVVLLSIAVWGFLLGPIGALLAVPLTMVIKIGCTHSEKLTWLAMLLAPDDGGSVAQDAKENPSVSRRDVYGDSAGTSASARP